MKTIAAFAITLATLQAAQAQTNVKDSVDSAYYLCALIDGTKLSSAPCEVSGWGSKVTATIDMTSSQARDLCQKVSGLMREKGKRFDARWTFQIKSPYSGDNAIAYCNLG